MNLRDLRRKHHPQNAPDYIRKNERHPDELVRRGPIQGPLIPAVGDPLRPLAFEMLGLREKEPADRSDRRARNSAQRRATGQTLLPQATEREALFVLMEWLDQDDSRFHQYHERFIEPRDPSFAVSATHRKTLKWLESLGYAEFLNLFPDLRREGDGDRSKPSDWRGDPEIATEKYGRLFPTEESRSRFGFSIALEWRRRDSKLFDRLIEGTKLRLAKPKASPLHEEGRRGQALLDALRKDLDERGPGAPVGSRPRKAGPRVFSPEVEKALHRWAPRVQQFFAERHRRVKSFDPDLSAHKAVRNAVSLKREEYELVDDLSSVEQAYEDLVDEMVEGEDLSELPRAATLFKKHIKAGHVDDGAGRLKTRQRPKFYVAEFLRLWFSLDRADVERWLTTHYPGGSRRTARSHD